MRHILLLLCLGLSLTAQMKEISIFPQSYNAEDISGIKILDTKELSFEDKNGIEFTDISALAYTKAKGLFALSNKGYLFSLDLHIKDKKIETLNLNKAMVLRTKKSKVLKKKKRDAEGMVINEEGLIISFERRPKVSLYDFTGKKIKNFSLPLVLNDIDNYQKKNKALEAVTFHPDFGIITAPEAPLKHESGGVHTLYSLSHKWQFKASGNITAIELMPDNNLLILERDYHFFRGHVITLKKVRIKGCKDGLCPTQTLASLKDVKGWDLDNFEGLTRIEKNIYMMVSDDNGSFFQKCILVLFEVKV